MSDERKQLTVKSYLSPGDILMLTAAVRELHKAHPNKYRVGHETACPFLWENNPYVEHIKPQDSRCTMEMHYPAIHQANQRPYHFIHGYVQYLEEKLNVRIPITEFRGDIHLSQGEQSSPAPFNKPFWIVAAGGKFDFTAKWWNPAYYQAAMNWLADALPGVLFVQTGEAKHFHPRLSGKNVVDMVDKTRGRDFIKLMYHADGVICPVTYAMHLAAAVPLRPLQKVRGAVVLSGGRESPHWEAYPTHQFLHTTGALDCCSTGGCWKARATLLNDGDEKEKSLCKYPVEITPVPSNVRGLTQLHIAKCMMMIEPQDVVRAVLRYYEGGALEG